MYTIGQVSEMFDLPVSTLRYYDKEGLFPELNRTSGIRQFSENEIEALRVIECLKKTGLQIKDIKQFMSWCMEAVSYTHLLRLTMFFHDFGKPDAKTTDENGTSHFKGHAVISEKKTRDILKRLKFDNNTINEVSKLVLIHDMKSPRDKIQAKKMMCSLGRCV